MKTIPKAPEFDQKTFDPSILSEPDLKTKVEEFNDRYLHWSEVIMRVDSEDEAVRVWNAMKFTRELSSVKLDLCGMQFSFCMIPLFTELLHYIDRDAAGRIETRLSGEATTRRYMVNSLVEESIASSQMEGAATTRKVAKQMLLSGRKPHDLGEFMIANNYLAMQEIKKHLNEELSPNLLLEMHRTITSKTLREGSQWEGRLRETDDIVVGDPDDEEKVYHRPPVHDVIPGMIQKLCDFANSDDKPYIHPVIKAIILHYMIGYIHPFVDGNGRLARSLFYWYCIKNGYWLFEYTSISTTLKRSQVKYGYSYQFTESDGNDLTYFIKYNLECIRRSVDDLTAYMDKKAREQNSAITLIEGDQNLNLFEATVLKDMVKDMPTFSIYEIQNRYGVAYQTARKHVLHLTDLGYISMIAKDGKRQLYRVNVHKMSEASKNGNY